MSRPSTPDSANRATGSADDVSESLVVIGVDDQKNIPGAAAAKICPDRPGGPGGTAVDIPHFDMHENRENVVGNLIEKIQPDPLVNLIRVLEAPPLNALEEDVKIDLARTSK